MPPRPAARSGRLARGGAAALGALVFGAALGFWLSGGGWTAAFIAGAVLAVACLDFAVARQRSTRAQVAVVRAPTDAMTGDRLRFVLSASGNADDVLVHELGSRGSFLIGPGSTARLPWDAPRRGVFTHLDVEVTSVGPCGLLGYSSTVRLVFPAPIYVGPQPVDPQQPLPHVMSVAAEGPARPSASGDIVRGVRPYVRGDSLRRVHWPATARTGDLVVMEVEEPWAPALLIVVSLGAGGHAGEQAAGRASWYANEAIRREYQVRMATLEAGGPVQGEISSPSDVNRRLAAAVPGPIRMTASGGRVAAVEVSDEGDRWVL